MPDLKPVQPILLADALRQARQTRRVEIGAGALGATAEVFRDEFGARPGVIVADETTFAVAGRVAGEAFTAAGQAMEAAVIFRDPGLCAEFRFVERLETLLRTHDAVPLAVGSGTINDLVKLAAHRVGRPYLCVATAASMDGYTAFGASITFKGSKQTFNCPAPVAVVADMDVIAAAPLAMTASGYADLLAKITAGADWIVADALGIEALDADAWAIVQSGLRQALGDPQGVRRRNPAAIRSLTEGLLMGGFAMQWVQSSRAASGAEHQFSHLWDMQHHTHNGVTPSHGFKVGVATVASAALYEHLLTQSIEHLDFSAVCARWPDMADVAAMIRRAFADPEVAAKAVEETAAKYITRATLVDRLRHLRRIWPALRQRLREQLLLAGELRAMLAAAGAPVEPEEIGIPPDRMRRSFRQACFIRRRYTVLDLAVETGLLDGALQALFGAGGCWPIEERSPANGALTGPTR